LKPPYPEIRVSVLDVKGNKISLDDGLVDTTDGRYSVSYQPKPGLRPSNLRVTTKGCPPKDYRIGPQELYKGIFNIPFSCGGP
jgi:hypothetical protein